MPHGLPSRSTSAPAPTRAGDGRPAGLRGVTDWGFACVCMRLCARVQVGGETNAFVSPPFREGDIPVPKLRACRAPSPLAAGVCAAAAQGAHRARLLLQSRQDAADERADAERRSVAADAAPDAAAPPAGGPAPEPGPEPTGAARRGEVSVPSDGASASSRRSSLSQRRAPPLSEAEARVWLGEAAASGAAGGAGLPRSASQSTFSSTPPDAAPRAGAAGSGAAGASVHGSSSAASTRGEASNGAAAKAPDVGGGGAVAAGGGEGVRFDAMHAHVGPVNNYRSGGDEPWPAPSVKVRERERCPVCQGAGLVWRREEAPEQDLFGDSAAAEAAAEAEGRQAHPLVETRCAFCEGSGVALDGIHRCAGHPPCRNGAAAAREAFPFYARHGEALAAGARHAPRCPPARSASRRGAP